MTLLQVERLSAGYGAARVIHELDLHVDEGSVVAMLGANGAGKTTTLRALSGMLQGVSGRVTFDGDDHTDIDIQRAVQAGIAHVPQGRGTFTSQTVEENLLLGGYLRTRAETKETLASVYGQFPQLANRRRQRAGTLSGGEQQMLAIGRALMLRPRLVLLDEPSLGLAPIIVAGLFEMLAELVKTSGVTMLIVEQHAQLALKIADRVYVLEAGRIAFEGEPAEIAENESLRRAYLGS